MKLPIATVVTYTISLISFFGFRFLTLYYQSFGYQLQYIDRSAEHVVLRGVDIIFLDYFVLPIFILSVALLFVASVGAELRTRLFTLRLRGVSIVLVALLLFTVHERVSVLARSDYLRDIDAARTTLPRLVCIQSTNQLANDWFTASIAGRRKILVLAFNDGTMVLFFAPPVVVGTPKVELFHVGISGNDIVVLVSGGFSGPSSKRSKSCIE